MNFSTLLLLKMFFFFSEKIFCRTFVQNLVQTKLFSIEWLIIR